MRTKVTYMQIIICMQFTISGTHIESLHSGYIRSRHEGETHEHTRWPGDNWVDFDQLVNNQVSSFKGSNDREHVHQAFS